MNIPCLLQTPSSDPVTLRLAVLPHDRHSSVSVSHSVEGSPSSMGRSRPRLALNTSGKETYSWKTLYILVVGHHTRLPLSPFRRVKVILVPSTTTSRLSSLILPLVETVHTCNDSTNKTRIQVNIFIKLFCTESRIKFV